MKRYQPGRYSVFHNGNEYILYVSKYNNRFWVMIHSISEGKRIFEQSFLDEPLKSNIISYIEQYENNL